MGESWLEDVEEFHDGRIPAAAMTAAKQALVALPGVEWATLLVARADGTPLTGRAVPTLYALAMFGTPDGRAWESRWLWWFPRARGWTEIRRHGIRNRAEQRLAREMCSTLTNTLAAREPAAT